jgi:LacI family transcriptional regulator
MNKIDFKEEKIVNIYDIAKKAKVAPSTVSLALNNSPKVRRETKEKIIFVASELKYHPNFYARTLKQKTSKTIGLIIPDIKNPTFSEVAGGAEKKAKDNGYEILLAISEFDRDKELEFINFVTTNRVDGLLVSSQYISELLKELLEVDKDKKAPVVIMGKPPGHNIEKDFVYTDLEYGGYLAISHLIRLGHKRIGFLMGVAIEHLGLDRLNGYKRALKENGIDFDPNLIIRTGHNIEDGYYSVKKFMSIKPPITAIFAFNDMLAISLIRGLNDIGVKVPDDMAVIGFDNIPYSNYVSPPLSTIEINNYKTGEIAVEKLLNRLKNPDSEFIPSILKPKLVTRSSCGEKK